MMAQLEAITQTLAQEMETTGTITLDGVAMHKNSTNPSPYAGLCHAAVEKLAGLVKESMPNSSVDRVSFTTVNDDAWKRSRHVIAEITTEEGVFYVDPTIRQYVPDAKMVYAESDCAESDCAESDRYPIEFYSDSINRSKVYNNL